MNVFVRVMLAVCLTAPLVASPASAQRVRVVAPSSFAVSGLDQTSGHGGASVTIRGRGFDARTTVFVGGREVRTDSISANAIVFRLPRLVGNGQVHVRHPGSPQVLAGTVVVETPLVITQVTAGPRRVGTTVDIHGSGFLPGDRVFVGAVELDVRHFSPTRITAFLAPGASTGTLSLLRASTGQRFESNVTLVVEPPPPLIVSAEPLVGPPGTVVRLGVENFQRGDVILFGRTRVTVQGAGPGWVDVVVPDSRGPRAQFTVQSSRGNTTFSQPFQFVYPPVVHTVSTHSVRGRDEIVISGSGFGPDVQVSIAGVVCRVLSSSPTRLVVEAPSGVRGSHSVVVTSGGLQSTSAASLHLDGPGRGRGRGQR